MVAAADSCFYCRNCGSRLRDLPTPETNRQLTECDKCMCAWAIALESDAALTFVKIGPVGMWPKRKPT